MKPFIAVTGVLVLAASSVFLVNIGKKFLNNNQGKPTSNLELSQKGADEVFGFINGKTTPSDETIDKICKNGGATCAKALGKKMGKAFPFKFE